MKSIHNSNKGFGQISVTGNDKKRSEDAYPIHRHWDAWLGEFTQ